MLYTKNYVTSKKVTIIVFWQVQDKSVDMPKPVRISKGIPQSFMVKAEPGTKGAMLTSTGEYAIPAIDAYVSDETILHICTWAAPY